MVHCTLYTVHGTLYDSSSPVHCTLDNGRWTIRTVLQCTVPSVQCTVYSVQCTDMTHQVFTASSELSLQSPWPYSTLSMKLQYIIHNTIHCPIQNCPLLNYTALLYTALYFTAQHCTALKYNNFSSTVVPALHFLAIYAAFQVSAVLQCLGSSTAVFSSYCTVQFLLYWCILQY